MLDNLITAYRAQIYDWNLSKWMDFCKKNKMLVIGIGIFILLIIVSVAIGIKSNSSLLFFMILLGEFIAAIFMDRHTVKKYRHFLLSKQQHLDKTVSFLKTVLPEKNLFGDEQIEELTIRLTKRIESTIPFTKFLIEFNNFAKTIILPVIIYIAGVYSGNLGQLDFKTVSIWAISVVLLLAILKFTWNYVFIVLRTITCRDHDAAIAFREDLMDIKLLYFSKGKI